MRHLLAIVAGVAACVLVVAPAARAADSSAGATALQLNAPQPADTTAFTVEPGEPNTTAPFGQDCASGHTVGAARTAWYSIAGAGGTVTISTAGSDFDTALFVYAGSPAGALAGCSDDATGTESVVSFDAAPGTSYAIQIGRACNETGPPTCASNPVARMLTILASGARATPAAPVYGPPALGTPALAPNAPAVATPPSIAGTIAPAALPALHASSAMSVRYAKRYTRVRGLTISGAPAGAAVAVSCLPRQGGCPFTSRTLLARSSRPLTVLAGAKLKRDVVVTVRVTKPGFVGWATRYTMRLRRAPTRRVLCIPAGETTERARC